MNKNLKKFIKKIIYNKYYYRIQRLKMKNICCIEEKTNIVFLVQRTEIFTSVMSVYYQMTKKNNVKVILVALPRYDHTADENKMKYETIMGNLEFCKKLPGKHESISSFDFKKEKFIDLKELNAKYIFLGLPYTHEYPDEYSFDKMSKYADLCYIPYGHFFADGEKMIENCFQRELLCTAKKLFCDCKKTFDYCKNKLSYCEKKEKSQIVYDIGFPRFDLIKTNNNNNNKIQTFLWLPRWTTSKDNNEKSSFMEYRNTILDFFELRKDLELIIRPHPLMFSNYINKNILTENEIVEYKRRIEKLGNVTLDASESYLGALQKADCVICDYTSIMIEFYIMNKPVLYLDKVDNMDELVVNGLYLSENVETTFKKVEKLSKDGDILFEKRKEYIKLLKGENIGKMICDNLLNEK
jgi:CDP-glycerol glycerophosphotransferase (TagB/SpsB family)